MATPTSWIEAVKARIPNQTLVDYTRESSETQTATTPDDARIDVAIDDARAEFATRAGFEAVLSDPQHVAAVVQGVLSYLMTYKAVNLAETETQRIRFLGMCNTIRSIFTAAPGSTNTGDDKITRQPEAPNNRIVRPDSDRSKFRRHYLPDNRLDYRFPGSW